MGRISEKQSPMEDEKTRFLQDGGTEDDTFYEEPPCMCAQQIISTLFGSILGYLALMLTPKNIYFPIAFMQGVGMTLGLLGAERSSLRQISSREPFTVSAMVVLATYGVLTVLGSLFDGEITLGTLLWTSFLLSNVATWTRAYTRMVSAPPSALSLGGPDSPATPATGSAYSTPDRRLLQKFKHSGDQDDWKAMNV